MKFFTASFPDSYEAIVSTTARDLWYKAYHHLRYNARFHTPDQFTHMDMPELNVTVARYILPENMSDDLKLHTTTVIERTVF